MLFGANVKKLKVVKAFQFGDSCLIDYKNPIFKPKKGKDFDDNPNHIN